jgi:lipopolysaccharide/colanic/teichoic acid biosynthesis glycosyltransferase
MTVGPEGEGTITTAMDRRITPMGRVLRRYKLDEYPQLWNVFVGKMSLVGPRPDVPGYADCLKGDDRQVLELRPGITGPASLLFRDEEIILANARDPQRFNDEVIYPAKVRINLTYAAQWSFWRDIGYIIATVAPVLSGRLGLDRRLGLDITAFRERLIKRAGQY